MFIPLIKKAIEINNNIKFDLLTNGLLFTEDFYNKLDLKKIIKRIQITVSAAKKQTYEKLLSGSDFKKVKENIKFIGELRKNNEIDEFYLAFVTSKINYKEPPEFIELCIKNNAIALIWELRTVQNTKLCQDIENQAVWKETHPNYNDFVRTIKLIKNKYSENSYILHDIFSKLEPISIIDELKTKLKIR